jgi:hypothetical protein
MSVSIHCELTKTLDVLRFWNVLHPRAHKKCFKQASGALAFLFADCLLRGDSVHNPTTDAIM